MRELRGNRRGAAGAGCGKSRILEGSDAGAV